VRGGTPFDAALDRGLGNLPDADRRLAHELAAGVLRHSQTLDELIARHVTRGIASVAPELLDVLRIATYQLYMLERIPPHAAVTTGVSLARERIGDHASGFANAVLRKLAAERATTVLEPLHLFMSSHPDWLVDRWIARFGEADTRLLLEWNNGHPPLVVQPARSSAGDLQRRFAAAGIPAFEAPFGAGLVVDRSRPELLPGFEEGAFFVQDPAQALVVRFADFPPGSVIYDACAAPGGKALALGRRARVVVAADASLRRIARLTENLRRAGSGHEYAVVADAAHPPVRQVTACFLDAPCLGTGTFARHPDARLRVRPEALGRLVAEQGALLDAAAGVVAKGGVLCYATCSLEPEENEQQVTAFLARHPEFRRDPPAGFPAELVTAAGDLTTLPQRDGIDGAFAARLVRSQ
jgi:16S rRNA (cytosine967-C5)-methyltransferase